MKSTHKQLILEKHQALEMAKTYRDEIMLLRGRQTEVLKYLKPHLEMMWAATVAGLLLGIDFRDASTAIKQMKVDN